MEEMKFTIRPMKDSGIEWIGEIPKHWEVIPTKYCFRINNGSDPLTKDGTTPVYGSGSKSFKTCVEYKEGPTVLLGRKGTIDVPQWVEGRYWNVDTAFDVCSIENYNLRLFYYATICFDYNHYSTQTALPSMTQSDYNNIRLPYTSCEEQALIANYLDEKCAKIDEAITRHKTAIFKLEDYRKAVITKAVTKGLNPNVEMKYSGLAYVGEMPSHWKTPRIKFIATFYNGDRSENYPSGDDIVGEGVLFITSDNIHDLELDVQREKNKYITEEKYNSLRGAKLLPNDIIYCLRGSIGICAINKILTEGTVASSLTVIRPNSNVNPDYLNYYLHSSVVKQQTDEFMNGSCAANLSAENVANYVLIAPPLCEQQQITQYLDIHCTKIDEAISRQKAAIEKLQEYRKSLIYYAVTGKIDCRKEAVQDAE